VSAIYYLLVDRCKKHQAAIAAGQSAPPPQPVTSSSVSPTHLPIATRFSSEQRRSSITTGIGKFVRVLVVNGCVQDKVLFKHAKHCVAYCFRRFGDARSHFVCTAYLSVNDQLYSEETIICTN